MRLHEITKPSPDIPLSNRSQTGKRRSARTTHRSPTPKATADHGQECNVQAAEDQRGVQKRQPPNVSAGKRGCW